MKHNNEIFVYDNIYFENGRKDQDEHPVVVVGHDDRDLYCFLMTSQTKHEYKYSPGRNAYNQQVKYIATTPNQNVWVNNNKPGLINTSYCFTVPIEIAKDYDKFGVVKPSVAREIMLKWFYQQNEIKDKKDWNYEKICNIFEIDDSIKQDPIYQYTKDLMSNYPDEIEKQKKYANELREYNDECYHVKKQNKIRRQNNLPLLSFPREPRLENDRDYLEAYSQASGYEANNPFKEFAEQYKKEHFMEEPVVSPDLGIPTNTPNQNFSTPQVPNEEVLLVFPQNQLYQQNDYEQMEESDEYSHGMGRAA